DNDREECHKHRDGNLWRKSESEPYDEQRSYCDLWYDLSRKDDRIDSRLETLGICHDDGNDFSDNESDQESQYRFIGRNPSVLYQIVRVRDHLIPGFQWVRQDVRLDPAEFRHQPPQANRDDHEEKWSPATRPGPRGPAWLCLASTALRGFSHSCSP